MKIEVAIDQKVNFDTTRFAFLQIDLLRFLVKADSHLEELALQVDFVLFRLSRIEHDDDKIG